MTKPWTPIHVDSSEDPARWLGSGPAERQNRTLTEAGENAQLVLAILANELGFTGQLRAISPAPPAAGGP